MTSEPTRIYFDFVDPLSYLVARELTDLTEADMAAVVWLPFELRPPPTPLITTSDPSLADRWRQARAEASRMGIELAPAELVPWTRKAHELMVHAGDGSGTLRMRIWEAYLIHGQDIGRVDVLVGLARDAGLDATESKAVLDVDRYEAEVAELRGDALAADVRDAPTIVRGSRRIEGFHNRTALGTFLRTSLQTTDDPNAPD